MLKVIKETEAYTLQQLFEELEYIQAEIAKKKKQIDAVDNAISERLSEKAKSAFLTAGKDTGTIHLNEDGNDIAVEISKTVKWDQSALLKAFDSLPQETARHYCKMTLAISEDKYKNAPPDIQNLFVDARTVVPSAPKYTFTKGE